MRFIASLQNWTSDLGIAGAMLYQSISKDIQNNKQWHLSLITAKFVNIFKA